MGTPVRRKLGEKTNVIWLHNSGHFCENSYQLKTQDNRTMIAPITEKGRPKRLNGVNIQRCTPYGTYFDYDGGGFG